jgi:hypothetical protein
MHVEQLDGRHAPLVHTLVPEGLHQRHELVVVEIWMAVSSAL